MSLKSLHQAGFETVRQAATSAKLCALTTAPCPSNHCSMSHCTNVIQMFCVYHVYRAFRRNRPLCWSTVGPPPSSQAQH